jgi:hypothetical protein
LTTLTLVEASKNHPAAASELNKLKKKGAGDILTQGVAEEASKYTISILSSVDNPLAQSVITADYKDFTLASIFDVNLSGCLFEMGVKGSRNEVSSRVFKVIGVAHAMLKVQQPTRFFLGLGNRDKKVSEHNLIAVDLGSPQDLRNKLQNATVIRQAMFKGELKESEEVTYSVCRSSKNWMAKVFRLGLQKVLQGGLKIVVKLVIIPRPGILLSSKFVTLNYVNWRDCVLILLDIGTIPTSTH